MAIVSISRIQHRRGLQENLPQLSSGEIGWSIDERRLYIGNGSVEEGAPAPGNTEILTEFSNILDNLGTYTYQGTNSGSIAQEALARSLQSKLDDFANVKDWGALGDGVTDDTEFINNALEDLVQRGSTIAARRGLYFPAGRYIITSPLRLPTWMNIFGEGIDSTIIRQTNASAACVVRTSDSELQTGASIGLNSATAPSRIYVQGVTFETTQDIDVLLVDRAHDVYFQNCAFKGNKATALTGPDTGTASIKLSGSSLLKSYNVTFSNCIASNSEYAVVDDDDTENVLFYGCSFNTAYKGFKIGENVGASAGSTIGPIGLSIKGCWFDDIFAQGVHFYGISKNGTAFNTFKDVGNNLNGVGNPVTPVIEFESDGNYSIGDVFERTAADDRTIAKVETNGKKCFNFDPARGMAYGRFRRQEGAQTTLSDNTAVAESTGLTIRAAEGSGIIDYRLVRGIDQEVMGELIVAQDSDGNSFVSEDRVESNGSIGVTFSVSTSGGITTLNYTSTSTGDDITFYYSIRTLE